MLFWAAQELVQYAAPDFLTFEFVSMGPRGGITKVIRYTEINVKGFYNLGLATKIRLQDLSAIWP